MTGDSAIPTTTAHVTRLADLRDAIDLRAFHRLLPEDISKDYPPLTRDLLIRVEDGLRRAL
ncbi:hypothetical protein OHS33_23080 [Streptomyces sp. NBC_00536]|uniref:hypothetical protein n=1 Tax=Streptomyces sp. NBC_00536 TaxID=2975769 RepID=UPI002E820A26|nr:hypothetical protein [Streptomyces sp. NBC_00536]WUC80962.1 hypothetical protein OHS33_23080 [Streptomyces sp. NBC_00536]